MTLIAFGVSEAVPPEPGPSLDGSAGGLSSLVALRAARGHEALPAFEMLAKEVQGRLQALQLMGPECEPLRSEMRVLARVHQEKTFDLTFAYDPFQATVSREVLGAPQAVYFCGTPTAQRLTEHQRLDRERREGEFRRGLEKCPPRFHPIASHGLDALRERLGPDQMQALLMALAEKMRAKLDGVLFQNG